MLGFFSELGILKKVRRTGWMWRNIPDGESIADHCFRVNLIAMFLCDVVNSSGKRREKLDAEKVMRMALLHEIAECRVGDIPYPALKYIGAGRKRAAEGAAVADMMAIFAGISPDYSSIWNEFEKSSSFEAKLVRAADKIEMLLQAIEYEKAGAATLNDFWANGETRAQIAISPEFESIYEALCRLRSKAAPERPGKKRAAAAAGKRGV